MGGPGFRYASAQYGLIQKRRKRCAGLVEEIGALPWTRRQQSELSETAPVVVIAEQDRYGIPLRTGLCLDTGLVFLIDRLTAEGYAAFYKEYYRPLLTQFFDRAFDPQSITKSGRQYGLDLYDSIAPWLPATSSDTPTLLDIGGSTGHVAQVFAQRSGYHSTVLDPASDELQVAADKGLEVKEGFLETYDAEGRQFDLVLLCQTIDHLFDLRGALARIYDLIKPGGFFFADVVDFDEACFRAASVEGALHLDHCYYLSQETALWLFTSMGWEVVQMDVAMRAGHVGYLLRRGDAAHADVQKPADVLERLRTIQRLKTIQAIAKRRPYGMVMQARKRAYRLKKLLMKTLRRT